MQNERKTLSPGNTQAPARADGPFRAPEGGANTVGPLLGQAVLERGSNPQVSWLPPGRQLPRGAGSQKASFRGTESELTKAKQDESKT